jgi:hypothetical protein
MKKGIFYLSMAAAIVSTIVIAKSFRVNEIPNGTVNSCATCHVSPAGGGARNQFGQTIGSSFLNPTGHVIWNADIANIDSDGDGFTNGEELQDPNGTWTSGAIGNAALVTNPGDPNSHPDPNSVNDEEIPNGFNLLQNYPNPFNPSTYITYTLAKSGKVNLTVYDVKGNEVAKLVNKYQNAGLYSLQFNSASYDLSSGVYFYKISSGSFNATKKMILLK